MRAMVDIPHGSADTARLFLALWPGAAAREALAAWQAAWTWPANALPVPPERLHLTLHFLGDVRRNRLAELGQGLASVPFSAFDLSLSRAAVWPHPDLAVLLPDAMPPRLLQLHQALRAALQALGVRTDDRAFRPHMTLARRAQGATPPAEAPQVRWRVREFTLVDSRPEGGGKYRVVQRYA